MKIQIKHIAVGKITVIEAGSDDKNNIELDMIFIHPNTGLAFKVTNISVNQSHISTIKLEQTGSYYSQIKDSNKAFNILYERLELVTDQEDRAACLC